MYKKAMKIKRTISAILCVATLVTASAMSVGAVNAEEITNDNLVTYGDVNLDGVISISDATETQKILTGIVTGTNKGIENADVYKDGVLNIADVTTISKYLVQTGVTQLPVETKEENISSMNSVWVLQELNLVNAERAKYGIEPLKLRAEIQKVATVRAEEISEKFSNVRPNGSYWDSAFDQNNVFCGACGENFERFARSPEELMKEQFNYFEEYHNKIINPDYKYIGIGIYKNSDGIYYWTQDFADDYKTEL